MLFFQIWFVLELDQLTLKPLHLFFFFYFAIDTTLPVPISDTTQPSEDVEIPHVEVTSINNAGSPKHVKMQNIWMDFEEFSKCFK